MAVFFRSPLTDTSAFEMIDERLLSGTDFDGYFNIHGVEEETDRHLDPRDERQRVQGAGHRCPALDMASGHFWLVYQRSDSRNDLAINEIRTAAIRLSNNYLGAAVVTLSLLGRTDSASDLELIFVCFREDSDRRNFRVRYEGKFVPDA